MPKIYLKNVAYLFDPIFISNFSQQPPLSKLRQDLILKAFRKLDSNGDGVVTVDDLYHVYSAQKHPKYLSGEWTEKRCFEEWLKTFDSPEHPDARITFEEFAHYYAGVSASKLKKKRYHQTKAMIHSLLKWIFSVVTSHRISGF